MDEKEKDSEIEKILFQDFCNCFKNTGKVSMEDVIKRSDVIAKFDKVFTELITEDGISINKENMLRKFRREFIQNL
jgi:hypothetical protein